jgi:hypothetical protein
MFSLSLGKQVVDSTAFQVFINKVSVPLAEIILDSVSNGRYYYSGMAYYSIETPGTAVSVHVYLEEVPFEPYVIYTEKYFHGNGKFVKIDSLSSGDIGPMTTKSNCVVRWSYSTSNTKNHCRIKIGTGNLLYAKTKDSLEGKSRWTYTYNNIGLLASTRFDSLGPGSERSRLIVPKYSRGGQRTIDDTSTLFAVNGYDTFERLTFTKEADLLGLIVNFFYGYVYDEKNRAIQKQQLDFSSTPQNHGVPIKIDTFFYDSLDRVIREIRSMSYNFYNPIFWPDTKTFNVLIKTDNYYLTNSDKLARSYSPYYDKDQNLKLICAVFIENYFGPASRLDSSHSIEKGLDSIGTVYGPRTYREFRSIPMYDEHDFAYRLERWHKYYSPDSQFIKEPGGYCYRREYDNAGNIIKQYDGCDAQETLQWSMVFNKFNAPVIQSGSDPINPGNSFNKHFTWELLDLDTAKEYYHE